MVSLQNKNMKCLPSSLVVIILAILSIFVGWSSGDADLLTRANKESIKINPDPNTIFPMVTTPLGQLRGQSLLSRSGRPYYAFRGVPYAQPPQRFQPSVMVEPWSGLLDARNDGAMCPQDFGGVAGDEDCLFLNIYFPHYDRCQNETNDDGQLPVFFHIHGGAFIARSGSQFGSKYLLDECIVFVTMNYRLGALGFLTTGDDVIPGNLGLKDQVLALTWTKQFISYFRGDPNLVNINGVSAGASSVSHLIASPMGKDLFATAMANSGSVICPWSIQENPDKYARELGQKLGCPSVEGSEDIRACLLSKDVADIIRNQDNGLVVPFGPTIEPSTASNPFQTENPAVVMRNGNFNRVPLITGFLEDEGINLSAGRVLADPTMTGLLNDSWLEVAPSIFLYDDLGLDQTEKDGISREIRQFYFGDMDISLHTRQELVNLYSDRYFVQGIFENVELHSTFASVYAYVMTYKGGLTFAVPFGYEIPVITHGDDIQFTFFPFVTGYDEFQIHQDQFRFSSKIIRHWTSFAKTGQPDGPFGDPWSTTTGETWHQLDLVEGDLEGYLTERKTFWKNLGLYQLEMN